MLCIYEEQLEIAVTEGHRGLLFHLAEAVRRHLPPGLLPVRFTVSETTSSCYKCESASLKACLMSSLSTVVRFLISLRVLRKTMPR